MVYKCAYATQAEREEIMINNSGKMLIEEQNITEGNFLIFSDTPPIVVGPKPSYEELENQLLLLMDSLEGGIL